MSYLSLSELYVYPIKSLGGVSLSEAKVEARGLQYDRRWLLVDEAGQFLTQRQFPQMALLKVEIKEDYLCVFHQDKPQDSVEVPLQMATKTDLQAVQIWDDTCEAVSVDITLDKWFSQTLGKPCHLVFMPESAHRKVEEPFAQKGEIVSFADGYPFLLIGQSSLDELNRHLGEPVPMNRFRPNMVFSGGQPFEEDTWQYFQINEVTFRAAKPCARCVVITIDQETAEGGKEPLKTLATFRKQGNKILFGQNLLHQGEGTIRVGDRIYLQ